MKSILETYLESKKQILDEDLHYECEGEHFILNKECTEDQLELIHSIHEQLDEGILGSIGSAIATGIHSVANLGDVAHKAYGKLNDKYVAHVHTMKVKSALNSGIKSANKQGLYYTHGGNEADNRAFVSHVNQHLQRHLGDDTFIDSHNRKNNLFAVRHKFMATKNNPGQFGRDIRSTHVFTTTGKHLGSQVSNDYYQNRDTKLHTVGTNIHKIPTFQYKP